jgi:hypothetical protein
MMQQKLAEASSATQTQTTTNARTLHHCRRRQRQRENIWSFLSGLPAPFGVAAPSYYRDLSCWSDDPNIPIVEWDKVPPTCEPCAFLSGPTTRRIKQGKSVKAVLREVGVLGADIDLPSADLEPSELKQLDRRGIHKRWQVMLWYY